MLEKIDNENLENVNGGEIDLGAYIEIHKWDENTGKLIEVKKYGWLANVESKRKKDGSYSNDYSNATFSFNDKDEDKGLSFKGVTCYNGAGTAIGTLGEGGKIEPSKNYSCKDDFLPYEPFYYLK